MTSQVKNIIKNINLIFTPKGKNTNDVIRKLYANFVASEKSKYTQYVDIACILAPII
jgi:hypothetical protein